MFLFLNLFLAKKITLKKIQILKTETEKIKINWKSIPCIKFADDIILPNSQREISKMSMSQMNILKQLN